ncbi:MAG: selenium cofactor biosynthesis protein YqeC [Gammaproteobacteria bacterium]
MVAHPPRFSLVEALCAQRGMICVVGAGGKKTTLYRLAAAHGGRIGITSTVLTPPFPDHLQAVKIIADEQHIASSVVEAARAERAVAFALPQVKRERLGGVSCTQILRIHAAARFDVTLIKADGARGRRIKAPGPDEPLIPQGASTVIPVVSARAMGRPLSERIAHRVARITAITGARPGETITPEHVARLLASEHGALKNAGLATVVPLINMVDDASLEAAAREAAELALSLCEGRFQRVVLANMRRTDAVIAVIDH